MRVAWEVHITSDPVTINNGCRVDFDDPAGSMANPDTEVYPANAQNN